MLDPSVRRLIDPPLDRAGRLAARLGIGPDAVTLAGFAAGLGAAVALAFTADGAALALLVVNRVLDGLDGAVARHTGSSDWGGYLDIVCDFIVYSAIVFGFAVGRPEAALPAAFLVFSFVGTGTTFLAHAVFAAKRGLDTRRRGRKSLYYIGGLTEGTETAVALGAICLWPQHFPWIAWAFGAACWITTGARILESHGAFRR